ncbi:hypothetical protein HZY97_18025 [Sphingomonas sp. R-74633]|uniref:hypothetical protein n=1 Tax=Sphingomonas sp. R-74633 TaxID=2751188 RepID=UPI0015D1CC2E|nr:hypothetical protein [Sphingomonas sp. R-74633]NYT42677.1 hypothetical protein [Sphingomonas sp. R-74633]
MDHSPAPSRAGLPLALVWQAGLVLAPGLLLFAPPSRGTMLLVPLVPASAASVENVGLGAGAILGSPGPLPASRFVEGERTRLLPAALAHGMILVSIAPRICGEATESPQ